MKYFAKEKLFRIDDTILTKEVKQETEIVRKLFKSHRSVIFGPFQLPAFSFFFPPSLFRLHTKPYCQNEKENEGLEHYFIMKYEHGYDAQDRKCVKHT